MEQLEPNTHSAAYANPAQVFVCVGIRSWTGAAPCHAWTGEFEILEDKLVNLRRDVQNIAQPDSPDYGPPPFAIRETRGRTSWGADSGEVIRIVLWVGQQASAALIGAGALQLFRSLAKRERHRRGPVRMTREEATARARWGLTAHYGLEAQDSIDRVPTDDSGLTVIGEEYSAAMDAWTITFRDADQTKYSVKFGHMDGLPTVNEISRTDDTDS